jgi:hypothetical protein
MLSALCYSHTGQSREEVPYSIGWHILCSDAIAYMQLLLCRYFTVELKAVSDV